MIIRKSLLLVFILYLFTSAAVSASGKKGGKVKSSLNYVSSIDYRKGKVIVKLHKRTELKYKSSMLPDGRFYIDILSSTVPKNNKWNIDDKYIKHIRYAQNKHNRVRVVLDLKSKKYLPVIEKQASKIIIDLSNRVPIKKSNKYTAASNKIDIRPAKAVKKAKKLRILIDPGHGGYDPGAIGPNGTLEKDLALDISKKLKKLLGKNAKYEVKLTRTKDKFVSLAKRKETAKKWKADLFLSIHLNGNHTRWLNQTEIYYNDKKSYKLAKAVRNELITELNRKTGYIKKKPYWVINNNKAKYGSVLVESCYLTSKKGENKLNKSSYRLHIAKGIYNSINKFAKSL